MSIGFAVDFPAHIVYAYYRNGKENGKWTPEIRIYHALVSIGYPLMQCGFSTILFVLCLLFVKTYMSEVFVKTMVLVVSLGLIHGLFAVPTILCAMTRFNDYLSAQRGTISQSVRKLVEKSSSKRHLIGLDGSRKNVSRLTITAG
jgi:hypothetical protein